jgi:hypothetical protein
MGAGSGPLGKIEVDLGKLQKSFGLDQPLSLKLDDTKVKQICRVASIAATVIALISAPYTMLFCAGVALLAAQQLKGYREKMSELVTTGSKEHRLLAAYATLLTACVFPWSSAVLLGAKAGAELGARTKA